MKVIVCGGRKFNDGPGLFRRLDEIHTETPITFLIEGGQRTRDPKSREIVGGADYWAREWAVSRKVPGLTMKAKWQKYGKVAGSLRNGEMLEKGPDAVIAFPGGPGTAHMVRIAKQAGVRVIWGCKP